MTISRNKTMKGNFIIRQGEYYITVHWLIDPIIPKYILLKLSFYDKTGRGRNGEIMIPGGVSRFSVNYSSLLGEIDNKKEDEILSFLVRRIPDEKPLRKAHEIIWELKRELEKEIIEKNITERCFKKGF